jgi:hypothetical protein
LKRRGRAAFIHSGGQLAGGRADGHRERQAERMTPAIAEKRLTDHPPSLAAEVAASTRPS